MTGRGLRRLLWLIGGLALVLSVGLVAVWMLWPLIIKPGLPFQAHPLDLRTYNWFDVGVVDANGDGFLDLFTSNHNARQSLLLGDGRGGFTDVLSQWGLDQDPSFPGLEDLDMPPVFDRGGLYVYWRDRALILRNRRASPTKGLLKLSAEVTVQQRQGFEAEITTSPTGSGAYTSVVKFTSDVPGQLVLGTRFKSIPIAVELDANVRLDRVFVGSQRVHPRSHVFELSLRDRHGMAWTDYNDDGVLDVFITRGALYGQMGRFSERFSDELLLSEDLGRYEDRAAQLGFVKYACPGRQVAWVDFDGDGRLDLYLVCGRGYPNQLHQRLADGRFIEVAARVGLDFRDDGTFLWTDVDADGDMDLLWASSSGLWLYRREVGRFEPEALHPQPHMQVRKLTVADFDADGDMDVFAASALGSRLLVNENGTWRSVEPSTFGLPSRCKTANWVDFDNDGLVDLHVWPHGLYRQQRDGAFGRTGLLDARSPYWWFVEPRAVWFDFDNDGDRDVLVLQRYFPRVVQQAHPDVFPFTAALFRNAGQTRNHWLQIQLVGPPGNRQAIGARVSVATPDGVQLQQVGQAEGSHYSQGDYRLYFGLGPHKRPKAITIHWPDGSVQKVLEPQSDHLLIVTR